MRGIYHQTTRHLVREHEHRMEQREEKQDEVESKREEEEREGKRKREDAQGAWALRINRVRDSMEGKENNTEGFSSSRR